MSNTPSHYTQVWPCPRCKALCTVNEWNSKRNLCNDCAGKRKYHNEPTQVGSVLFDSKAEANYYQDLLKRLTAGEIGPIILQPEFPIVVNGIRVATYYGDFQYTELATRDIVTIDVKGVATPLYKLKKRLVEALYSMTITEVSTTARKQPTHAHHRPQRNSTGHRKTDAPSGRHAKSPGRRTA